MAKQGVVLPVLALPVLAADKAAAVGAAAAGGAQSLAGWDVLGPEGVGALVTNQQEDLQEGKLSVVHSTQLSSNQFELQLLLLIGRNHDLSHHS